MPIIKVKNYIQAKASGKQFVPIDSDFYGYTISVIRLKDNQKFDIYSNNLHELKWIDSLRRELKRQVSIQHFFDDDIHILLNIDNTINSERADNWTAIVEINDLEEYLSKYLKV